MIEQGLPDPHDGPDSQYLGPLDLPYDTSSGDAAGEARGSVGFGAGLDAGAAQRKKKSRSRRKKKAGSDAGGETGAGDGATVATASSKNTSEARGVEGGRAPSEGGTKKRRRRSRRKKTGVATEDDAPDGAPPAPKDTDETEAAKKRRRRGSRGGRRRKKGKGVEVDSIPGEEDDLPDLPDLPDEAELLEPEDGAGRGRTKAKKSKKKSAKKAARKSAGRSRDDDDDDEGGGRGGKKKRKRSRSGKAAKADASPEELEAAEEERRDQLILVNSTDPEEKRVAVVAEDGRIVDLLMTAESQKTLVNDIYRGKVVNLEPAIGAAFVDFGQGRNGFLHTSDVLPIYGESGFKLDQLLTASVDPDEWDDGECSHETLDVDDGDDDEPARDAKGKKQGKQDKGGGRGSSGARRRGRQRLPINDLLRVGDPVVVQITKDAIGDKGPTLTTYISIPGRYLVLMPSMARTGVSRKIPDDKERRRLKRILSSLKAPTDMGVIVRTAGVGKTKTDLQRDLDYLLGVWETFGKRLKHGRGPTPLYQESDVAHRTLRDLFNQRTREVVVDDPIVYDQLIDFAKKLMPEHEERIKQHDGDRPIFHHHGIEQDFERVFARRVELPSGGSIVFDQAEALVAIDVNSGRTRTDSYDFEEIALKTNLEAVPEIARQIRLRDLGGILVCDFIDMMKSSSNRAVERALRTELADDRARSKLGRISQFGLLEMTRQRLGPGTHKKVFQSCPRCRGTGRVRTVESRAQAILRRLGSALSQKGFSTIEVRAHPEVVQYLKEDLWDYMRALEHRFEREIQFTGVADQPEDSVLRYLRTDGREVRPGGRRKR
jgi:ribonuclease E